MTISSLHAEQVAEDLVIRELGRVAYHPVWQAMQDFTATRDPGTADEIWCLEHEPVFTQGQAGRPEHILNPHDVPVVQIDRGGQVTYHGPGQLVVYLMIDIRRRGLGPRQLVDLIEESILSVLRGYGLSPSLKPRAPGVYVNDAKIAALGLRIRRGCSFHGLGFNIDMDLTPFSWINPCGYAGLSSTQLRDQLDRPPRELFHQAQQRLLGEIRSKLL